ncbi:MAG TPA: hypothetical protein VH478_25495 [Trebonia sp.]|jgi:hypothetical protein|nr:hypothetical protein [Trebonia sp.]
MRDQARPVLVRRLFPLLTSAGLIIVGMLTTTWGPDLMHRTEWALPYDYWGTLVAAARLGHGHVGGIYAQPTGLVSLPGTAVILVPVAWLVSALGLSLDLPGGFNPHPGVWLVAGPYQIALSCLVLFAADALAERLDVPWWKRGLLSVAEACALWSPSARWGHPEDAVATGLLLYAVLALARGRAARAGWLAGAAVCVQPLVLLALPMLAAMLPSPGGATPSTPRGTPGRRAGIPGMPPGPSVAGLAAFLIRAALPSAVALAVAGIANWGAMYAAVTSQPNSPVINHPTAWTPLAAHVANGNVAAGPFRLATIALACCCAVLVRRRLYPLAGDGPWTPAVLTEVLWWMALALALRSFFEPVMVSYYPWPPLAVALVPAATGGWARLVAAGVLAGGVTAQGQGPWHNVWAWWVPLVAGLLVFLLVAWRPARPLAGPGVPLAADPVAGRA